VAFPKGIRTRATSDWFALYMSQGGYGLAPGTINQHYVAISLYNDSTQGYALFVWTTTSALGDVDFFNVDFVVGPFGDQVASCARINPTLGAPPGQILLYNDASSAPTLPASSVIATTFAGPQMGSGPIYIVPANYSLVLWSPIQTNEAQVSYWYMPMIDTKGTQPA
jgi:hypothetical protein